MENSVKSSILTAVSTGQQLSPTQVKQLEVILSENTLPAQAGLFDMHFNHDALSSVYDACGIPEEALTTAQEEYSRMKFIFDGNKKSQFVELFFSKASITLCKILIIENIARKMEGNGSNPLEDLMRGLKGL